jgi:hypothetical protein
MLPDPKKGCHRTGFEKPCMELLSSGKCDRWKVLPGEDPNTKAARQEWGCIDDLMLVALYSVGASLNDWTKSSDKKHNADVVRENNVAGEMVKEIAKMGDKMAGAVAGVVEGVATAAAQIGHARASTPLLEHRPQ